MNKEVADMTPQAIYEMLPYSLYLFDERTRSRYLSDSEIWWDQKDDVGLSGELILDLPDAEGILRDETESESGCGLSSDGEELNRNGKQKQRPQLAPWKIAVQRHEALTMFLTLSSV